MEHMLGWFVTASLALPAHSTQPLDPTQKTSASADTTAYEVKVVFNGWEAPGRISYRIAATGELKNAQVAELALKGARRLTLGQEVVLLCRDTADGVLVESVEGVEGLDDVPKLELAGAYSWSSLEGIKPAPPAVRRHGWNLGVSASLSRKVSVVAEVGQSYGSGGENDITSFLGGVRGHYRGKTITLFGHFLAGNARGGYYGPRNNFSFILGGGIDLKVAEGLAIRVQPDLWYAATDYGGPRVLIGVVWRIGKE